MDRHEPEVHTTPADNEVSAARRMLNGIGNFIKDNKNKLTATAVAGVLTLTLAGCGTNAKAEGPEPSTTTSASESPNASESPAPTPTETEAGPKKYSDQELVDMMNEPLPESLKQYESMSVADFEALPIEERLSYCSYLNRDQDFLEGNWYDSYNKDPKYLIAKPISKSSSAQDVVSQSAYSITNAFTTHFGGDFDDIQTRQKDLSCFGYGTKSQAYLGWVEELKKRGDEVVPPGVWAETGGFKINDAVSEEDPFTLTTDNGKEYFARKITSVDEMGRKYIDTYILVDYTDYKGAARQSYVFYK